MTLEQHRIRPTANPSGSGMMLQRKCTCGGTPGPTGECAACRKKREAREGQIQRSATSANPVNAVPSIVHEVLNTPGQPLEPGSQAAMESRFQHDFSGVRIHTDARAAASAQAVNALAYTVGRDVVFAGQQYRPATSEGRKLLAHELTHVLQQKATSASSGLSIDPADDALERQAETAAQDGVTPSPQSLARAPVLQRKLVVNPNATSLAPATDPAGSLTSAQRFSMMDSLIQGLCPEFEVDQTNGEVVSKSRTSLSRGALATGNQPMGCCCLSILTDTPSLWTIEVSQVLGPFTSGHRVVLPVSNSPVEFGSFTGAGNLAFQGQVPAAGHELCGHAALSEISAHPIVPAGSTHNRERLRTDIHDPTVNVENLISTEQGVAAADLRGLARSGTHRGESVDRIILSNYPFNETEVSSLPAAEQAKLQFAADYIRANQSFVDIVGHSDDVGSPSAKQFVSDQRAQKVRTNLSAAGIPSNIVKNGLPSMPGFGTVRGVSDNQPPPAPLASNRGNWRRVELLMAGEPAGAQRPPSGTPTGVAAFPTNPNVATLKASGDPCEQALVRGAYP